jgi:hypothetical protein
MPPVFFFLSAGGFILALGLGAKFAAYLGAYGIPLIVVGLLIHGAGHVLQYRSDKSGAKKGRLP